jgi:hypothetical protein
VSFLILDGLLGYPAKLYDASWMEWGQMTGQAGKGGALAADSPWRTDVELLTTPVHYSVDMGKTVDTPTGVNSYAPRADLVSATDGAACGGNRGGGGPAAPGY